MQPLIRNREFLLALVVIALLALIGLRAPEFVTPGNLAQVFTDTSILMMLALGQMAVIMTRCIDLSVAANLALSGMVVAMVNAANPAIPMPVLLLLTLVVGGVLGAINGLLVWRVGIPSIVVTLGTLSIYRGTIFLLSGGAWINSHQMSPAFIGLPRIEFLGLPLLAWTAIIIVLLGAAGIAWTRLGRAFYAVGGNPTAAVYAGLDVGRTQFAAYVMSGLLAGLSGYLWVSRYAVAYVDIAGGFELDVIAACVIGGVSIAGGIGTVGGAVLGALFLGITKNALPVIGVSPFWQMAISGGVIIAAVIINARSGRRRGRLILREAQVPS